MKVKEFLSENKRLLFCTALAIIAGALIGISIGIALTPAQEGAEVAAMELVSIGPNTVIKQRLLFTDCTHVYEKSLDNALYVGDTREEISARFINHGIVRFSAEEIILEKKVDGCCARHYRLHLNGAGELTVSQFNESALEMEDTACISYEKGSIDADAKNELSGGLVFESTDAVNAYIEGLEG